MYKSKMDKDREREREREREGEGDMTIRHRGLYRTFFSFLNKAVCKKQDHSLQSSD